MGMIRQRKATEQQKAFVQYLVRENKKPTEAARLAGYLHPKQSAYDLTRNPSVMLLIRQARQTVYQTDLANLAADTLRVVMVDPDAPASARVSAARTALELSGDLNKGGDAAADGRSLAEMTPDELASMIDRWETERAELANDVTPAPNDEKTL
jgi:phage terminase small subunit